MEHRAKQSFIASNGKYFSYGTIITSDEYHRLSSDDKTKFEDYYPDYKSNGCDCGQMWCVICH